MVVPSVIGVLLATGACSSGGGGGGDEVAATSSVMVSPDGGVGVPVTTDDGRMLQPEGHVGIWFETEPSDPLDRLVWKSQQFVGQPLDLEPLGDGAWSPAGAGLPNVCAPKVIERMGRVGMAEVVDPDFGPEYVLCGVSGRFSDSTVRNIGFLWGSGTSGESFVGNDGIPSVDDSGIEILDHGGYSERVGCIAFRNSSVKGLTLFSYSYGLDSTVECSVAIGQYQVVQNILGGNFV